MAQFSVSEKILFNDAITGLDFDERRLSTGEGASASVMEHIISEGGKDFYNYLSWIGLSEETRIMVLSSLQHYYYDHNDLKSIGVLVNIKKLNQITHLESFLRTLFRILPCKSHFVGCFSRTKEGKGKAFRLMLVNFFQGLRSGSRCGAERTLTKEGTIKLLETNGFIMRDMTEINGITYFWAQNIRQLGD